MLNRIFRLNKRILKHINIIPPEDDMKLCFNKTSIEGSMLLLDKDNESRNRIFLEDQNYKKIIIAGPNFDIENITTKYQAILAPSFNSIRKDGLLYAEIDIDLYEWIIDFGNQIKMIHIATDKNIFYFYDPVAWGDTFAEYKPIRQGDIM